MRHTPRPLAVIAMLLLLSGCAATAPASTTPPASVPAADALVGGGVDVWFRPDGAVELCMYDIDPGFSADGPHCGESLGVTGVTAAELREQLRSTGMPSRSTDVAEIVPAFVVGRLSGRTLDLVSTDLQRYAPEGSTTPTPQPSPAPSFATDEEKLAYARSQPLPQPEGCTAPESGWGTMSGVGLFDADAYQSAHPDAVLGNAQSYVDYDNQIAIIAVAADADPQKVRDDLSASYPNALCVIRSALTTADLDRVQADPVLNGAESVLSAGLWVPRQSWDDPNPRFTSYVTVLTSDVADAAARYPAGLVTIVPWFGPVVDRGA